jgi:hypothetical protein
LPRCYRASRRSVITFAALILSVRPAFLWAEEPHPSLQQSGSQIAELCRLLRFDPSFKVRTSAARKLGELAERGQRANAEVVRALADALADSDHIVRGVSANSLGKHGSDDAVHALQLAAKKDEHPFVRESALRALETVAQRDAPQAATAVAVHPAVRPADKPRRVELGRVEMGRATDDAPGLREAISDAIDDLLGPRKPAMFPREDADVRLDVDVSRLDQASRSISYRVRVVIIELPGSKLRHAANATATASPRGGSAKTRRDLEKKVALEATTRAVNDALALLDAPPKH